MKNAVFDRRHIVIGGAALAGATPLMGCDKLTETKFGKASLQAGEDANLFVQRLLLSDMKLAPEYAEADISPWFKPNGTEDPPDRAYKALAKKKFADFHLVVDGLVERPFTITLAEIRKLPSRTQITRHDCVEGWSCIGKWTGVPLHALLERAGLKPNARYIVLHCADTMEGGEADDDDSPAASDGDQASKNRPADDTQENGSGKGGSGSSDEVERKTPAVRYYESIDLRDAYHPQTILAYEMNGTLLPVAHGAPLRLRLERQLGYKSAKYVTRLEIVENYHGIGDGRGGYWEDRGYDWYAGI